MPLESRAVTTAHVTQPAAMHSRQAPPRVTAAPTSSWSGERANASAMRDSARQALSTILASCDCECGEVSIFSWIHAAFFSHFYAVAGFCASVSCWRGVRQPLQRAMRAESREHNSGRRRNHGRHDKAAASPGPLCPNPPCSSTLHPVPAPRCCSRGSRPSAALASSAHRPSPTQVSSLLCPPGIAAGR